MLLIERNDRPPSKMRSSEPNLRAFETKPSHANVVAISFGEAAEHSKAPARQASPKARSKSAIASEIEKPETRRLLIGTIIFSAVVHAAAIAATMPRDSGEQFGTVSEKTDTISLSMTQTVVLESTSTDVSQMAAAASAASQAGGVQSAESKPQELQEVKDVPVSDQPPPKPIKVADVTPTAVAPTEDPLPVIRGGGEADTASEIKADQIAEKNVEEMPEEVETKENEAEKAKREKEVKKEKKTAQEESHQQAAGSATSRSSAAQAAVNGRVSASNGNALSYAASIRAQVERNKPSGNGLRGTVRVSFGITTSGELTYVRLSESSGNSNLDDTALAAVRHSAPFEEPPPDLSPTQLAFVIPFYFR